MSLVVSGAKRGPKQAEVVPDQDEFASTIEIDSYSSEKSVAGRLTYEQDDSKLCHTWVSYYPTRPKPNKCSAQMLQSCVATHDQRKNAKAPLGKKGKKGKRQRVYPD